MKLKFVNCRWIKDGRLPYTQVVDLLPDDMHFSIEDRDTFYAKVLCLYGTCVIWSVIAHNTHVILVAICQETWVSWLPMIFFLHLYWTCTSSWDRPKLFICSLKMFHSVILGCPLPSILFLMVIGVAHILLTMCIFLQHYMYSVHISIRSVSSHFSCQVKISVFVSALYVVPHSRGAQAWITQCYLQLHQCLPLPGPTYQRHPDPDCPPYAAVNRR